MATVTELVREVADFAEREPRSVLDFNAPREVATLNDLATVTPFANVREAAVLNDYAQPSAIPIPREVAYLNDTIHGTIFTTRTVRETARLSDRDRPSVRVTLVQRDTAVLNDTASPYTPTVLHEAAVLNDAVVQTARYAVTVRERAEFADRALAPTSLVVRDTAVLNDDYASTVRTSFVVHEAAVLNDGYSYTEAREHVEREVAAILDRASNTVQTSLTVRDTAFFADAVTLPQSALHGTAYTCSIASWGLSTFSNYPFRTMAGNYAAGDNLWRLDADDDYGTAIDWHITTGMLDMGASMSKRLSAIYVSGSADAPLDVTVTADVNGVRESYDYSLELRDQSDYRNNRALVGKGFRGRFVQVKIGGSATKAILLAAEADVAVTPRRV